MKVFEGLRVTLCLQPCLRFVGGRTAGSSKLRSLVKYSFFPNTAARIKIAGKDGVEETDCVASGTKIPLLDGTYTIVITTCDPVARSDKKTFKVSPK
jgi:hypothetical protein